MEHDDLGPPKENASPGQTWTLPSPGAALDRAAGEPRGAGDPGTPPTKEAKASPGAGDLTEIDPRLAIAADRRLPASFQHRDRDRYEIIVEHGRGGLGRVYRARDKELARDVALKELLREPNQGGEARFLREAMLTARLEHPGIVPVHEAGRWPDGTPFYAMKLVAGRPLAKLIAEAKTFSSRLALLPHLIAVADAMAYAHARQIIHRDLKPSNVIVGEYGETIVIDWGVAKDLAAAAEEEAGQDPFSAGTSALTVAGAMVGTPAYMSPEQFRGESVDARTDVYALGAMLFELCTGSYPPRDETSADRRKDLRHVPEDLAAIALKALSEYPNERYADAGAFAADLRAYDAGARITAREYSLVAILGHWIRRHKRLALSIAIPAVIMAVLGTFALREIIVRGDRAEEAQRRAESERAVAEKERAAAEEERDRSIRSEAAMLLEKDPTKARDLLAQRKKLGPAEALLMARAQGAGAAERIVSLHPYRIFRAVPDENLETLAVVAADNKLRVVDLSTGAVAVVDTGLLEPTLLVREHGGGFTYGRRGSAGAEIVRAFDPQNPIPIAAFRQTSHSPAVATANSLFLLEGTGNLLELARTGKLRLVHRHIRGIAAFKDGLLACTNADLLRINGAGQAVRIDGCRAYNDLYPFATDGEGYMVQVDSSKAVVRQPDGARREVRLRETDRQYVTMAGSGLVVGLDNKNTWYLLPGGSEPTRGPSSDATPTALAADGALAAWGYDNGVTRVRDTHLRATWTFLGNPAPLAWVFLSERLRRIVTVAGPEIRVWRIPPFSFEPIGTLTCGVFNISVSSNGRWVAFDCAEGQVNVYDRTDPAAGFRTVHQHDSAAFGITWRANEICSSGWDGKILCTDVVTKRTVLVADHARPTRFVHSAGDVLAYTIEDGTVWSHHLGAAASQFLYRHRADPYRVAVSPKGNIASGAQDGSVMAYDPATATTFAARTPHSERVSHLLWRGEQLHTAGWDGTARTWSSSLAMTGIMQRTGPLLQLGLLNSGWIANVAATRLWVHTKESDLDIDTGPLVRDLSISTDGRFAGAVVGGDLVIYDTRENALAAVRISLSSGHAKFVDAKTIFAYGPWGEILSLSVDTLLFVRLSLNVEKDKL